MVVPESTGKERKNTEDWMQQLRGIFFAWDLKEVVSTMEWCLLTDRDVTQNFHWARTGLLEWWQGMDNPKVADPQNVFFPEHSCDVINVQVIYKSV